MATFIEAVTGAVRGGVCNVLSNPLVDGRQWGPRPPYVGEGVATNPLTRAWYNRTIDGLRSMFCDAPAEQEDPDERFPVPFEDGQCAARYTVEIDATNANNGNVATFPRCANGPIGGVRVIQLPSGQWSLQILAHGSSAGTTCNACPTRTPEQFWQPFSSSSFERINPQLRVLASCDVPSGSCGDPPVPYNPTNIFNFQTNVTYTDNSNNTYNELGDFNLFAPVFLPGSVQIPFNFSLGGVEFSGDLFPDGQINIQPNFDFNVGSERDPGGGENVDLDPDPEYEVDPSEDQEAQIVGAWVVITTDPTRASGILENGVTHLYPRAGILKWRIALGNSTFVYSEGQDIKTRRAWVPIPRSGRVIGADFFGYYGSEGSVTLAYAEVPQGLFPAST